MMTRTQYRDSIFTHLFTSGRRQGMTVRQAEAFAERQTNARMRIEAARNIVPWDLGEPPND